LSVPILHGKYLFGGQAHQIFVTFGPAWRMKCFVDSLNARASYLLKKRQAELISNPFNRMNGLGPKGK